MDPEKDQYKCAPIDFGHTSNSNSVAEGRPVQRMMLEPLVCVGTQNETQPHFFCKN